MHRETEGVVRTQSGDLDWVKWYRARDLGEKSPKLWNESSSVYSRRIHKSDGKTKQLGRKTVSRLFYWMMVIWTGMWVGATQGELGPERYEVVVGIWGGWCIAMFVFVKIWRGHLDKRDTRNDIFDYKQGILGLADPVWRFKRKVWNQELGYKWYTNSEPCVDGRYGDLEIRGYSNHHSQLMRTYKWICLLSGVTLPGVALGVFYVPEISLSVFALAYAWGWVLVSWHNNVEINEQRKEALEYRQIYDADPEEFILE